MASPLDFWNEAEWVSADIIREIFNERQVFEQANRSELKRHVWNYDTHLTRRQRQLLRQRYNVNEPRCTRSQIVLYLTSDNEPLALVHQYRRPNGELGGSGRPDPKRLFIQGRIIAVRQSP